MNLGQHFRDRTVGASDDVRALLEELQSAFATISTWTNREHNDEGQHINVTAHSVTITAVRGTALSVANGLMNAKDAVAFSGTLTPAQIAADTNNYSPLGVEHAFLLRLTSDALRTLTGLQDGPRPVPIAGRTLFLFNAGSNSITLTHEDVLSDPNFRFRLPGSSDVTVPPNGAALLYYDGTARRWIMIGASGGTGASSAEFNAGDSGPSITIDWASGVQQILNLTHNAAITLSNPAFGTEYRLLMTEGGSGNWTPTFDASVIFEQESLVPAAIAPGETLILHLIYTALGGGTYLAWYTPYEAPPDSDPAGSRLKNYDFIVGDGVNAIVPSGIAAMWRVPASGLITGVTLVSTDPNITPCFLVLDIWKDTYANYPPTIADTITALAKPTLSSGIKYQDTTLSGWDRSLDPGDFLAVYVESAALATRAHMFLTVDEGV